LVRPKTHLSLTIKETQQERVIRHHNRYKSIWIATEKKDEIKVNQALRKKKGLDPFQETCLSMDQL
jgi:hypothetical protein